jgi:hypothetical protein
MNIFAIIYNGALDRPFIKPKEQRLYDDIELHLKIVLITILIIYILIRGVLVSGLLRESNEKYKLHKKTFLERYIDDAVKKIKGKTVVYKSY